MKRRTHTKKAARRSFRAAIAAAGLALGLVAAPKVADAQEIQFTGPLAGQPSVRKLRLYRQGRVELAIGPGFTLLDEYKRTIFIAGRLQYNLFDFLGFGVFGGYAPDAFSLNTDLTDKIESLSPRNSRTAVNLPPRNAGPKFEDQVGKMSWMVVPQVTFSPFRGKLAVFQKLFVDTDLYLHGGVALVGVKERANCGGAGTPCSALQSFKTNSRVAVGPSFGLGLTLYPSQFVSINVEYRALPFSWNRGGFDSRGGPPDGDFPDQRIDSEDRTFKFNQMVFIAAGFHLPTKAKISD